MNQPKFKFTDLLRERGTEKPGRKPIGLYLVKGYFYYRFNEMETGYSEELLELYQEPQKKKLYAYKTFNGYVNFKTCETQIHPTESEGYFVNTKHMDERAPEYDIEYPETK